MSEIPFVRQLIPGNSGSSSPLQYSVANVIPLNYVAFGEVRGSVQCCDGSSTTNCMSSSLVRCIEAVLERKRPGDELFSVPKKPRACPGAPSAHRVCGEIGHGW
jgi:hypothetical protein